MKKRELHISYFALSVIILSGCSSITTCPIGQVEKTAYEDGLNGAQLQPKVKLYQEACLKQGKDIDLSQYTENYQQGLKHYCKLNLAFELGRNGGTYRNVCSDNFTKKYLSGLKIYQLEAELKNEDIRTPAFNNGVNPKLFEH